MGLNLRNEFTVAAPLDQTWETLLDIGRVAGCMPGAKIESGGEDGVYRGTMKVKLGPMNLSYEGVAKLAEVDTDRHACTLEVTAKEQRGTGTASATITNHLIESGSGTKVEVETDLAITGRQAQFGRGIMEDVASKMLDDFATRLEREILSEPVENSAPSDGGASKAPVAGTPTAALLEGGAVGAVTPATDENDVLDLGDVVGGPLAKRAAVAGLAAVIIATLLLVLGRRGKGFEMRLRLR